MKSSYSPEDVERIAQLLDSTEDMNTLESDLFLEFGISVSEAVEIRCNDLANTP
jgi:hypothetical protein